MTLLSAGGGDDHGKVTGDARGLPPSPQPLSPAGERGESLPPSSLRGRGDSLFPAPLRERGVGGEGAARAGKRRPHCGHWTSLPFCSATTQLGRRQPGQVTTSRPFAGELLPVGGLSGVTNEAAQCGHWTAFPQKGSRMVASFPQEGQTQVDMAHLDLGAAPESKTRPHSGMLLNRSREDGHAWLPCPPPVYRRIVGKKGEGRRARPGILLSPVARTIPGPCGGTDHSGYAGRAASYSFRRQVFSQDRRC
jgi:hypothetical protein